LIFVTAFESRVEFQQLTLDCPWGAAAWFADEPDHLVHFDYQAGGSLNEPDDLLPNRPPV
jgi:hypothetical protein